MFKTLTAALSFALPSVAELVSPDKGYAIHMKCTDPDFIGLAKEWPVTMTTGLAGQINYVSEDNWYGTGRTRQDYMCTLENVTSSHLPCTNQLGKPITVDLKCTQPTLGNAFLTISRDMLRIGLPVDGEAYLTNEKGESIGLGTLAHRYCYIEETQTYSRLRPRQKLPSCIEKPWA
ncbi:hypothetical protein L249_8815 [Ophiocordyceps polyrhachis-furcata BCC 54312]|uniref:Uncharacterized protein n=1 Tax=Ophiocordyceps polyrhachis-furcata BCC 54312 TaxID=1330021 RepID=A0A367L1S3_9HYPO|nr:hypothetical protein L249_8815 [Ophiocordyceps polyrhachis-furcata BCC 54312]